MLSIHYLPGWYEWGDLRCLFDSLSTVASITPVAGLRIIVFVATPVVVGFTLGLTCLAPA
jgi:hypothetical protein